MDTAIYDVVKRENNAKRSFMVVNRYLAKLIPSSPKKALSMIQMLANKVKPVLDGKKVLVLGFAESAISISLGIAEELDAYCINTTREKLVDAVIDFEEEHSHAVNQQIAEAPFLSILPYVDHILFVEDEVTTGHTICNCVKKIDALTSHRLTYSVASLIKAGDGTSILEVADYGIDVIALEEINTTHFDEVANRVRGDGQYYSPSVYSESIGVNGIIDVDGRMYPRYVVNGKEYMRQCEQLAENIMSLKQLCCLPSMAKIAVIGTEEFAFPALVLGIWLEDAGFLVDNQVISRSPLVPDRSPAYLIHSRYALHSLYEEERNTFLYNLKPHDLTIVLTDAKDISERSLQELHEVLSVSGQEQYVLIRWRCGNCQ